MDAQRAKLRQDIGIIVLSIFVAINLAQTDVVREFLTSAQGVRWLGSFFAGMFFTTVFTSFPAMVVLGEIAQAGNPLFVAFFGGLGALIGDFVIFRFVRDRIADDFDYLIKRSGTERFFSIFHRRLFRWFVPFIGALVVASPLPDEIGLTMMGLSKMKNNMFIPVSFTLNFLGIFVIGLIAKSLV